MFMFNLTAGFVGNGKWDGRLLRSDLQIEYERLLLLEGDPAEIPTPEEIGELQSALRRAVPEENRDRAYLELLYYCGLSVQNISNLRLRDLNLTKRTLTLRREKKKGRVVPLGENTIRILDEYLQESRVELARDSANGFLFVNSTGGCYSPCAFQRNWYRYLDRMNLARYKSVHCLRGGFLVYILSGSFLLQENQKGDGGDLRELMELIR